MKKKKKKKNMAVKQPKDKKKVGQKYYTKRVPSFHIAHFLKKKNIKNIKK